MYLYTQVNIQLKHFKMSSDPVCIDDFEQHAKRFLPKTYWKYYSSGSYAQISLEESKNAFKRLRLRPRVLRDVSSIDMSTTILGDKIDFPICVAPTAVQKLAHPDGEIATAKASYRAGSCMVLSTWATSTIEEVAQSSPEGLKWFHMYILTNESDNLSRIRRAEKEGYKALVVTVDAPYRGSATKHPLHMPPHLSYINVESYNYVLKNPDTATPEELAGVNPKTTWDMVQWLRSVTKLPIILKGILTAEDARLAVQHAVDGIIVSIHGGRELDTVPAPIEVLPEIIAAVDNNCEVYLDGGIRYGTDVFKALALGARAVFIGRPVLWGLAYQGEEGIYKVLQILKEEFKLAMGLMGCASLKDISREMVVHQSHYSKI